jgi:H-NS histone family
VKTETLETLSDEELQGVIARCNELLKERDRRRKDEALEQARAILAVAGLNLRDVASGKTQKNGGKGPVYHGGRQYQHPVNKGLTWNAKGQKPTWLRELEAEGRRAVEIEAANDNFPPSVRKTG